MTKHTAIQQAISRTIGEGLVSALHGNIALATFCAKKLDHMTKTCPNYAESCIKGAERVRRGIESSRLFLAA